MRGIEATIVAMNIRISYPRVQITVHDQLVIGSHYCKQILPTILIFEL